MEPKHHAPASQAGVRRPAQAGTWRRGQADDEESLTDSREEEEGGPVREGDNAGAAQYGVIGPVR